MEDPSPVEGRVDVRETLGGLIRPAVLVATRSPHKLAEIRELLDEVALDLVDLGGAGIVEDPSEAELEPFETFAGNARSKAAHFCRRSGLPTLADDSGLCVDALGGGPGVRTKRFAPAELAERHGRDRANNLWLLERLSGVGPERRTARYRCAIALAAPAGPGRPLVVEGTVEGHIATAPRGEGGFGYDPLFVPEGHRRTFGELPPEVKREISHRSRAIRAMRPHLEALARGAFPG